MPIAHMLTDARPDEPFEVYALAVEAAVADLAAFGFLFDHVPPERLGDQVERQSWLEREERAVFHLVDDTLAGARYVEIVAESADDLEHMERFLRERLDVVDWQEVADQAGVRGALERDPALLQQLALAAPEDENPRVLELVVDALRSPDRDVRLHAVHAAGLLSQPAFVTPLEHLLAGEADADVATVARRALELCRPA